MQNYSNPTTEQQRLQTVRTSCMS
uniref:Uncharacterized protein n=1 Tax=Arundo donax TaxID=35708 RepID=A0A0A9EA90_ARUDO